MTKKKPSDNPKQTEVASIKGFDRELKCRDFQFEFGKTYTAIGTIKACGNGFHGIEGYPLEVFNYYAPGISRYADVLQSGDLSRHPDDSKLASATITIGVELRLHELIQRAVKWVFDKATPENTNHSTGYQGAASSTGYQGAASSTGHRGAASSTGDRGAASSTGYRGAASSMGYRGAASSTGDQGAASSTGYQGAAMASGFCGKVMGTDGNALFLVFRNDDGSIRHAWAGIVGSGGIKPGVWYRLNGDGQPEESAE